MGDFTKKYYIGLAVFFIAIAIFYWNSGASVNINGDLRSDAMAAVDVADLYLEGSIDSDEATERMERIHYKNHVDEEKTDERFVGSLIQSIKFRIRLSSDSDVKKSRNDLAKEIKYKR